MKHRYPCETCLVKSCCTEYCSKLETDARIINLHILTFNECPDCGERGHLMRYSNNQIIICKSCMKIFEKVAVVKENSNLNWYRGARVLKGRWTITSYESEHPVIITDPYTTKPHEIIKDLTQPPEVDYLTMEETHDMLYTRKPSSFVRRALIAIEHNITQKLSKPIHLQPTVYPKQTRPFKIPKWARNYPLINQDTEEDDYNDYEIELVI